MMVKLLYISALFVLANAAASEQGAHIHDASEVGEEIELEAGELLLDNNSNTPNLRSRELGFRNSATLYVLKDDGLPTNQCMYAQANDVKVTSCDNAGPYRLFFTNENFVHKNKARSKKCIAHNSRDVFMQLCNEALQTQQYRVVKKGGGVFKIKSKRFNGRCLGIPKEDTAAKYQRSKVGLYGCTEAGIVTSWRRQIGL